MPNVKFYYMIVGIFDYKYQLKLTTNSMTACYLHPVFSKKPLVVVTTWLVWSVQHLDIWITAATAARYEYNSRD